MKSRFYVKDVRDRLHGKAVDGNRFGAVKAPFTRAIFVAIFLILTHAIEWLSHKSIDLYSFPQMV